MNRSLTLLSLAALFAATPSFASKRRPNTGTSQRALKHWRKTLDKQEKAASEKGNGQAQELPELSTDDLVAQIAAKAASSKKNSTATNKLAALPSSSVDSDDSSDDF
jgi:hypothetical protein